MKMHVDLQKLFPIYHVCPKCLAALLCGSALQKTSGIGWSGKDTSWLATWEYPLRTDSASLKSLESFIQSISFCSSCILPVSSRIVSWSSTNFLLATVSNVDPCPTWNAFDLVAPNCRFLYDATHCGMNTQDGTFAKVLKDMGRAVIITCLKNRKINEGSVNSGQCACCTIGRRIFPCKDGLCDFKNVWEKGPEKDNLHRITICEGLVPDVESSFLKFTTNNAKRPRISWLMRSDKA